MLLNEEELRASARRQQNFEDLQAELSGHPVKMPRFLSLQEIERIRDEKTGREDAKTFHQAYVECIARQIEIYALAAQRALEESYRRVVEARRDLEQLQERAVIFEGKRVYRSQDRITGYYEDGTAMTPAEIRRAPWVEGAPTWEDRQAAGERFRQANRDYEAVQAYKERVDYYSATVSDDMTPEDVAEIRRDLGAMPQGVRDELLTLHADFDLDLSEIEAARAQADIEHPHP